MSSSPSYLARGERARLFPVLADTSKEGRTVSILLACMENIEEFGRAMLSGLGQRVGARAKVETYTEVVLQKAAVERGCRPDGLIVLRAGANEWSALVEAKVGNSDLTAEQVEMYLELAKLNGVKALLTISNQFAPLPSAHPVAVPANSRKKADLFHWSWMHVLTEASLLLSNGEIADQDQRVILNEMVRFLSHPSAGVKGFDQMPASWTTLVNAVQAGGAVPASSTEAREVVAAWHQEVRDLSLTLSRQLGRDVNIKTARAHAVDPSLRQKADMARLSIEQCLTATLAVPDAAAPIDVNADFQKRTVAISMRVKAPEDRKSTKARVSWLLRQLQKSDAGGLHLRLHWPGRGPHGQYPLAWLRDESHAVEDRPGVAVSSFEILLVRDLGARFAQRKAFITELEAAVPDFYERVGQHLKAWQPAAPKLREEKAEPETVAVEALGEFVENE